MVLGASKSMLAQQFQAQAAAGQPAKYNYSTKSTFGNQYYSNRGTAPSFGFGTMSRERQHKVFMSPTHSKHGIPLSPGPAVYSLTPSVGNQLHSKKETEPKWQFGTDSRFKPPNKMHGGNITPGPGAYII